MEHSGWIKLAQIVLLYVRDWYRVRRALRANRQFLAQQIRAGRWIVKD